MTVGRWLSVSQPWAGSRSWTAGVVDERRHAVGGSQEYAAQRASGCQHRTCMPVALRSLERLCRGSAVPLGAAAGVSLMPSESREVPARWALSHPVGYLASRRTRGADTTSRGQIRGQRRGQREVVGGRRVRRQRTGHRSHRGTRRSVRRVLLHRHPPRAIVTLARGGRGAQTDVALEGQPSPAALASADWRRGPTHIRRGQTGPLYLQGGRACQTRRSVWAVALFRVLACAAH